MVHEQKMWDVIVVGGGAAAWSAALYASRRQLSTLVIAKDIGGQALLTQHIENYPGINRTTGSSLVQSFWQQAEKHGAKTKVAEVVSVRRNGDAFEVQTATGEVERAKTIIFAFGLTPKNLDVPGEAEFRNKGVHYCATCDGPFYKGKTVAVVGGTNGAKDAALLFAKMCPKVYMVHGRDSLVGDKDLIALIEKSSIIEVLPMRTVKEVHGEVSVTGLVLDNGDELIVDGIFVELGHLVKTDFVKNLVQLDERRHIVVDKYMRTSAPGVFAAGDVTQSVYKQVVISAGEGAVAALEAYQYLQKKNGKPVIVVDWDK